MTDELLPIASARSEVLEVAGGRLGEETVAVGAALDRVLAGDVVAAADVPPFPSSAMDGYAVASTDTSGLLSVVGEARAGQPHAGRLSAGQAIRISTGAAVPDSAVAVIRQEDIVVRDDGQIEACVAPEPGSNIRQAGEDMRGEDVVLATGTRLGPVELGAAVAAGAGQLSVGVRPTVTVLCTGDELRAPGEPLRLGEIHNSNGPMLTTLAKRCGADTRPAGCLRDDPAATELGLSEALEHSDVVIVCGGVSVGPHDHVKPALAALGVHQHFWRVALQPGRPTWFGSQGRRLVFALPGNPVSAAVTFTLFVRPALDALLGAQPRPGLLAEARLATPVKRNPARDQAIRVQLERHVDGIVAAPAGAQGSHLLTSLLSADALAIVPRGDGILEEGASVRLEPAPGREDCGRMLGPW